MVINISSYSSDPLMKEVAVQTESLCGCSRNIPGPGDIFRI
jgi:hypothetical protein